jgi:hypothetical protein
MKIKVTDDEEEFFPTVNGTHINEFHRIKKTNKRYEARCHKNKLDWIRLY